MITNKIEGYSVILFGYKAMPLNYQQIQNNNLSIIFVIDLSLSSLKYLNNAFNHAENLTNIPNSSNNSIIDLSYCFYNCLNLNYINICSWNITNVINKQYMFFNCAIFNHKFMECFKCNKYNQNI